MAEVSKIQWTHATFNPWRGCTKVSEGCAHCYAETMSGRNPAVLGVWGSSGTRVVAANAYWRGPVQWDREARVAGERRRVFCASLADVFEGEDTIPSGYLQVIADARARLFRLIDMTPHLDWLLLTKRPENVRRLWPDAQTRKNVWLGTTTENQKRFRERLPHLLQCRWLVSVLFLSLEPMLELMDVRSGLDKANGVGWVIVGGESGGGAREFNPEWARLVRDQCLDAGVPLFVKQMGQNPTGLTVRKKGGELDDIPSDIRVREFPTTQH